MSKSKYPNKIDSSKELPIVRDNILQIGSEVINSIRSAVLQIEKTLGVLPNGSENSSVSDRLNKSLDELGNIKKSAISTLNLLQGPITNSDVADGANIDEKKIIFESEDPPRAYEIFRIDPDPQTGITKKPSSYRDFGDNLKYFVVDCLRYKPHYSHFNLNDVLKLVKIIKPQKTILTNLNYEIDYSEMKKKLPKNIIPAFDGLSFYI